MTAGEVLENYGAGEKMEKEKRVETRRNRQKCLLSGNNRKKARDPTFYRTLVTCVPALYPSSSGLICPEMAWQPDSTRSSRPVISITQNTVIYDEPVFDFTSTTNNRMKLEDTLMQYLANWSKEKNLPAILTYQCIYKYTYRKLCTIFHLDRGRLGFILLDLSEFALLQDVLNGLVDVLGGALLASHLAHRLPLLQLCLGHADTLQIESF